MDLLYSVPPPQSESQSVSVTHLLAWRTGPHAHTRCTRLAREPTRGTLSPAVALGPDCWTHNTQLTVQLTRWRYIVGFAGTGAGEEGGAQGQGHRTHELTSHPAPGAVARAAPGSLDPQSGRRQATQRIRRQSLEPHVRDPRRLTRRGGGGTGRAARRRRRGSLRRRRRRSGRSRRDDKGCAILCSFIQPSTFPCSL